MGVPATRRLLEKYPNPNGIPTPCIIEALQLCLEHNVCTYTFGNGSTTIAKPCQGVALGPCHACDYVDIFMHTIDKKLVETSPVPLLSSLRTAASSPDEPRTLDWSRFRDDGITLLLHENDLPLFQEHLQQLYPPNIKWTFTHGKEVNYLDLKIKLKNGYLETSNDSKSCHKYLPPNSCHPQPTFKGLLHAMGTKLRMNCSTDASLHKAQEDYAHYFSTSGWDKAKARKKLKEAGKINRDTLINGTKTRQEKKIPWITTYDPRAPSKGQILRRHLDILYSDKENTRLFPKGSIIAAEKRRKNLGEIFKPTIPRRFVQHGPAEEPGFFPCQRKCDFCRHGQVTTEFVSPWDGRLWKIKKHLSCTTPMVIYMLECTLHRNAFYIGSTKDVKARWRNHKSDFNAKRTWKCGWAAHSLDTHPDDREQRFVRAYIIDAVKDESMLLPRELWWQANTGSIFVGLNSRHELL